MLGPIISVNTPLSVRIIFWVLFFAEVSAYVFGLITSTLTAIACYAARPSGYTRVTNEEAAENEGEKHGGESSRVAGAYTTALDFPE